MINYLVVDDRKKDVLMINQAILRGISLTIVDNLEDMIFELKRNWKFNGVILDGKGFMKRGQEKGSEAFAFVHEALTQIQLLERENDCVYAKCVLTGFKNQLEDSLKGRVRLFDKGELAEDDNKLNEFFEFLKKEASISNTYKLGRKYKDVLEIIETGRLSFIQNTELLELLTKLEFSNNIIQKDFNGLRQILESVLIKFNDIDKTLIPDELFSKFGPNLKWCKRYLLGLEVLIRDNSNSIIKSFPAQITKLPGHIGHHFEFLLEMGNTFSHPYNEKWTRYAFRSSILALIEILIWVDEFLSKNYSST